MRADIINEWLIGNGLPELDGNAENLLSRYQQRVLEVNKYMNLTAITGDEDFAVKHFIDSFTLLPWICGGGCPSVIDIGTGAGFPGIPLKIVCPNIKLTLVDSLRKRVFFLRETLDMLGISDVECIHARAEEIANKDGYRENYDICMARAVARLDRLVGYAMPLLKPVAAGFPGGLLLAMKGPDVSEEIKSAKLNYPVETRKFEIAEGMTHTVIAVRKVQA